MGFNKSTASKVGRFFRHQGWIEKKTKTDYRNCDLPFSRWFSERNISIQVTKTEEIKVEERISSEEQTNSNGKRNKKNKKAVKKSKKSTL